MRSGWHLGPRTGCLCLPVHVVRKECSGEFGEVVFMLLMLRHVLPSERAASRLILHNVVVAKSYFDFSHVPVAHFQVP